MLLENSVILDELLDTFGFSLDIEHNGEHWKKDVITRIGFGWEDKRDPMCMAVKKKSFKPEELLDDNGDVDQRFLTLLESGRYKKIGSNIKDDCKRLTQVYKVVIEGIWFDTMIAARLLATDGESAGLKYLGKKYLGRDWGHWQKEKDWLKDTPDKTHDDYEVWLTEYNATDCEITYIVAKEFLKPELAEQELSKIFEIEMEVVRVFYKSELAGVPVDVDRLIALKTKYSKNADRVRKFMDKIMIEKLGVLELSVKSKSGVKTLPVEKINYNSSQQLVALLYETLKCEPQYKWKKTADGLRSKSLSTDKECLVRLARDEGESFVRWILFFRYFKKLASSIESIIEEAIDGILYQDYNTCGTETHRFSEHYLQCIPGKTSHGVEIKKCFHGKSKEIWCADYSNVELRILASVTQDPKLLGIYLPGGNEDAHQTTADAYKALGVNIDRHSAKTVNFGISYGMEAKKLMGKLNQDDNRPWKIRKIKKTLDDAQLLLDSFFRTYFKVPEWKQQVIQGCVQNGYVKDLCGRRRRLDFTGVEPYYRDRRTGVLRVNPPWAALEREAVNSPIQMTSASITKMAICELSKRGLIGTVIGISLQIHDELVGDIYDESRLGEVKEVMEGVMKLSVPLKVDFGTYKSWGDSKVKETKKKAML